MAEKNTNDSDSNETPSKSSAAYRDSSVVGSSEDGCDKSYDSRPRTVIKPVAKKIGESHDNLRGRSDWYGRRTGGGKHSAD